MKHKFTIVSAFLFCLSLAVAGCGAKDPFAGFEVPGYQAAPDTIFTDDTAANGLEGSAMYVDATVGASGKIGEYDSLTFTTSKGDLSLMDSALGSNWASLEEGQKIRAYFFTLGQAPSPKRLPACLSMALTLPIYRQSRQLFWLPCTIF